MRRRPDVFNPKRLIRPRPTENEQPQLDALAEEADYGGNPEHKRDPGDFGLSPPARPRPGKTLCDGAGVIRRADARTLLREGFRRGLVSVQVMGGRWPKNVWAVTPQGQPLEAQLEQQERGIYHGYPLVESDPLYQEVIRRWNE